MYTSINLPKVVFSRNFTEDLKKVLERKKYILITSKFWIKKKYTLDIIKHSKPIKVIDNVSPNPELKALFKYNLDLKELDFIVSLGGGSVIDFTKALLGFYLYDNKQEDFYKCLSLDKECKSSSKKVPKIIAIPTTSGTGSEVNSWGTLWNYEEKLSVKGKSLMPYLAILDPSLSLTMPNSLTISTALDALSHAFEAIWNKNFSYLTDEISLLAISKIYKFLPLVLKNNNIENRHELQMASLLAGISMSQTKTAICHSISYPLTAHYNIPHGIACALTLSEVAGLVDENDKKRLKVFKDAFNCYDIGISENISTFLKSIGFSNLIRPFFSEKINENINFINPSRAKNTVIDVTNELAIKIIKRSFNLYK